MLVKCCSDRRFNNHKHDSIYCQKSTVQLNTRHFTVYIPQTNRDYGNLVHMWYMMCANNDGVRNHCASINSEKRTKSGPRKLTNGKWFTNILVQICFLNISIFASQQCQCKYLHVITNLRSMFITSWLSASDKVLNETHQLKQPVETLMRLSRLLLLCTDQRPYQ